MSAVAQNFRFDGLKARWEAEAAAAKRRSVTLERRIREECPALFRRYGVQRAVLYGSVADGRATERSDVDLFVTPLDAEGFYRLLHDLEDLLEVPIDLVTNTDDPEFVERIQRRGSLVYGQ